MATDDRNDPFRGFNFEVEIDNLAAERACGIVRSINLQAAIRSTANRINKFIGVDGSQLTLPAT